jgi:hypothetical protein
MTAEVGEKIILDKDSANPVTIALYVVNANGKSTTNENDLSLGARITYGSFRACRQALERRELGGNRRPVQ